MKKDSIESSIESAVDALCSLEGIEAKVTFRRYLGSYTHEHTAQELGISVEESRQLAISGLIKMKQQIFGDPPH
jgi:DNA-directed RNA polymerase specialized sigma24 family protein